LSGTAITAAVKVSLTADQASGSVMAATYTSQPFLKASTNTETSGRKRKRLRKVSATPIRLQRTQVGSLVALLWLGGAAVRGAASVVLMVLGSQSNSGEIMGTGHLP